MSYDIYIWKKKKISITYNQLQTWSCSSRYARITPTIIPLTPPPSRLSMVTSDPRDGGLFFLQDESMIDERSYLLKKKKIINQIWWIFRTWRLMRRCYVFSCMFVYIYKHAIFLFETNMQFYVSRILRNNFIWSDFSS